MTHEVHATDDKHNGESIYGDTKVKKLVKKDPGGATKIADNYSFFSRGLR